MTRILIPWGNARAIPAGGSTDALERHQWMHGPLTLGGDLCPRHPLTVSVPCRMEEPSVSSEASGDQRCYVGKSLPKTLLHPPRRRDIVHQCQSRRMKALFVVTHENSNASSGDRLSFFGQTCEIFAIINIDLHNMK